VRITRTLQEEMDRPVYRLSLANMQSAGEALTRCIMYQAK
jgi:hypothetical protein